MELLIFTYILVGLVLLAMWLTIAVPGPRRLQR
jgi:hypothetical protein